MKNIKLRQFKKKDEEAVYDLHIKGLKQSNSFIDDPKVRKKFDQDLRSVREKYIKNAGEFFVAVLNNKIVGMGGLRKVDENTAEVKRMRVDSEFQGKKIGSLILDKLIERAKEFGYKKLVLDTTTKQITAQRLYESRGFKEYRRRELYGLKIINYELDI